MDESSIFEIAIDDATFVVEPQHSKCPYDELRDHEIRLLEILAGAVGSEICCQIVSVSLQDEPVYTALSYVWGRGPAECAIKLNGQRFYVRKNLWRFLNRLRRLNCKKFGRLWIDALCINQSNDQERTDQVSIMPKIYSTAEQVVLWLGPEYQDSDKAMQKLSKPLSFWRAKRNLLKISNPIAGAIRQLCLRTYWTRLWILQELLLAREAWIMCGARVISWRPFRNLLLEIGDNRLSEGVNVGDRFQSETIQASPATYVAKQSMQSLQHTALWNLMFQTQGLGCSEVKDRVYALLGIAESGRTGFVADYSMPIPTLLNRILKHHFDQSPPTSLKEVANDCEKLESLLSAPTRSMFSLAGQWGFSPVPNARSMALLPFRASEVDPVNLWWASFYDHLDVRRLLFAKGALNKRTILMSAIGWGDVEAVRFLLRVDEVELDYSHRYPGSGPAMVGETPLHIAARLSESTIVKLLLDTGRVNVNWKDRRGETPMYKATQNGSETIVKLLLDTKQVNLNSQNEERETALHKAAKYKREGIAKLLLNTGQVDVNLKDDIGRTALHRAGAKGCEGIVRLLLNSNQIDINSKDGRGCTPLLRALRLDQQAVAKLLINIGKADVNQGDLHGRTPLAVALDHQNEAIIVNLLKTGQIDLSQDQELLDRLIRYALSSSKERVWKLLIDMNNCDVGERHKLGQSVLDFVAERYGQEIAKLLASKTAADGGTKDRSVWKSYNRDLLRSA